MRLVIPICLIVFALIGGPKAQAESIIEAMEREAGWSASVRAGVQNALMWTGDYQSRLDGEFGPMTRRAIESFQRRNGFTPTGYLTSVQIALLEEERREVVDVFGYQIREFTSLGIKVGLPMNLVGEPEEIDNGIRFHGAYDEFDIVIDVFSQPQMSPDSFIELHARIARNQDFIQDIYYAYKPDWFVVSADTVDGFHIYTFARNDTAGLRGFTLFYHASNRGIFGRLSTAMFNSLEVIPRANMRPPAPVPPMTASRTPDSRPATTTPPSPDPEGETGSGTGFVINAEGFAVTNHHVVSGCARIRVNGAFDAAVVVTNEDYDLAVLRISPPFRVTGFMTFRSVSAALNEDITVLGFPLKGLLESINVTRGSVSSLSGLTGDLRTFQITAPVQPGNSGGPVIDASGLVIGIVQSKLDAVEVYGLTGDIPQNVNFAINGSIAQLFLAAHNIAFDAAGAEPPTPPVELASKAREATILVECLAE